VSVERDPISFTDWTPVVRDYSISYAYTNPATGRRVSSGGGRWMVVKLWMAEAAIATGAAEFDTNGGMGDKRWRRTVTISQDEADEFFKAGIAKGFFTLKGTYRRACVRRRKREAAVEGWAP